MSTPVNPPDQGITPVNPPDQGITPVNPPAQGVTPVNLPGPAQKTSKAPWAIGLGVVVVAIIAVVAAIFH